MSPNNMPVRTKVRFLSVRNQTLEAGGRLAPRSGQLAPGNPLYLLYRELDGSWALSELL
jgi:hypothetical protein